MLVISTNCTLYLQPSSFRGLATSWIIFLHWPVVFAYAAWHQMVPICLERWYTEANKAT